MLRRWPLWALPILACPAAAGAAGAADSGPVVACDTLLAARRAEAASPAADASPAPECRRVARDGLGAVEQRAMIGGAPYECLTVAEVGRCLWLVP